MDRNNVLTASRMSTFLQCQRKHYWQCEVGLRKETTSIALLIGSAWARAMEARWKGQAYEQALAYAIPEGLNLDPYVCAKIGALLICYYRHYGRARDEGKIQPEVQFNYFLTPPFWVAGKLDGLGIMNDGRKSIVEGKTTGESISPSAEYWMRLRFNMQLYQYILAARKHGWEIDDVIYDVTRKPSIKPKTVYDLDEAGLKIVLDRQGKRVYKANGEPRESGSEKEGFTPKTHVETPDEYSARLIEDCNARPDFYFARRSFPIIDADIRSFEIQREVIAKMILTLRSAEKSVRKKEDAWPRNATKDNCKFCQFQSFCLQNIQPTPEFTVQPFNPELESEETNDGDEENAGE